MTEFAALDTDGVPLWAGMPACVVVFVAERGTCPSTHLKRSWRRTAVAAVDEDKVFFVHAVVPYCDRHWYGVNRWDRRVVPTDLVTALPNVTLTGLERP